jgi:chitodextrinase
LTLYFKLVTIADYLIQQKVKNSKEGKSMKWDRGRTEWIPALGTLMISVLLLVGCTSATASQSPVINSLTAESDVLLPSQTCEIACNASNLDGGSLSYQWLANRGNISGEGPVVTWTAPDTAGNYTITVSVSDGSGGQSIRYLPIEVAPNNPPTIESLDIEEDEVTVSEDCQVVCVAADRDGGVLSYEWSASGGNISGEGPTVNWTAPDAVGTYTITVTVTDGQGGENTASLDIDVLAANNPPKVKGFVITDMASKPCEKNEIYIDKHYYIECIASDPDGDKLSYDWSVSEGAILEDEGSKIYWRAPDNKTETIFEVTVQDERGGEDVSAMRLEVFLSKCDSVG